MHSMRAAMPLDPPMQWRPAHSCNDFIAVSPHWNRPKNSALQFTMPTGSQVWHWRRAVQGMGAYGIFAC